MGFGTAPTYLLSIVWMESLSLIIEPSHVILSSNHPRLVLSRVGKKYVGTIMYDINQHLIKRDDIQQCLSVVGEVSSSIKKLKKCRIFIYTMNIFQELNNNKSPFILILGTIIRIIVRPSSPQLTEITTHQSRPFCAS